MFPLSFFQAKNAKANDDKHMEARKSYNARLALTVGLVFGFFCWITLGLTA